MKIERKCRVVEKTQMGDAIYMVLGVGDMVRTSGVRPGQFVHINCGHSRLLRRPISICQWTGSKDGDTLTIVFEVRGEGTVDAIFRLAGGEVLCPKIGVLNFASAKNPGGGFLNGSVAQEECLALCSNLYQTQTTGQGPRYYEINRANRDPVYTDTMLIGDVTFFRTSDYALTEHSITCPVITAPAVNMGIVLRNGDSADRAKAVMKGRMRKVLALFARWGCTELVLGAYGCGVFRNDPEDVARFWQELLLEEGWGRLFEAVTFSILERPGRDGNIAPFRRRFS